ncbi:hypothetical protein EVAR_3147_1 [Eumeta japonica]|uniref:Uncharacterized protein n=1 Tax=Eumeta variegata TaxID=151549 RepID=A0A4C1XJQ9_EUMVA|nr:hypothetical protein EVAR_3147_1 [Eumeta japonica]
MLLGVYLVLGGDIFLDGLQRRTAALLQLPDRVVDHLGSLRMRRFRLRLLTTPPPPPTAVAFGFFAAAAVVVGAGASDATAVSAIVEDSKNARYAKRGATIDHLANGRIYRNERLAADGSFLVDVVTTFHLTLSAF